MNLIENWQKVAKKAWSFRLAILSAALSGAEVVVPLFVDAIPRGPFAALSFLTVMGAAVARVIAQPKLHDE